MFGVLQEFVYSCVWGFLMLLSSCLFSDGITHAEQFYAQEQSINGQVYNPNPDCKYAGWKFGVGVGIITWLVMTYKCWLLYKEMRRSGFSATGGDGYEPVDGKSGDGGDPNEVTVSV